MSQHAQVFTPHKCWFCPQNNPSYRSEGENCQAATIPTQGHNAELGWTIFSFGSHATVSERSSFRYFSDAMKIFDTQDRIVIRLGNEQTKYVLVRYSQHGETLFSIKEGDGEVTNTAWDEAEDKDRISLFRFVDKILEGNEENAGTLKMLYTRSFP